ncbi:MAG: cytochrome b/b6 domain-containing protein [Pseudomonadota bacterium]
MARETVEVWDLPLRLFKWGLVASVFGAFAAMNAGDMELHKRCGYVALTLVVFRVIWGFVGSQTARFRDFVRAPAEIRAYLKEGRSPTLGHSPLGGLAVLALLGLVAAQAITGLFSNDDIFFDGPWAGWAGKATSDAITGLHHSLSGVLIAMIVLHIIAITVYAAKGDDLVSPMLTGAKRVEAPAARPTMVETARALVPLVLAAFAVGIAFRFWIL